LFILTGFQENIKSFYPIIDVFFLPSLYEGLPMVLLEAMAFNIPVVSMDVGSISELIHEGETGYLINKGNYHDFVIKLNELKSNEKLMKKLGKSAFEHINKNYNIEVYSKSIENIYTRLIK
ncbi:glycosyltransferase, partial [uncultured Clostridium sp.]|uniref:glycosyltransferase n=1 Tax=uncultured Clostridium sp. TaxID=59620 RepID=UPI002597B7D0